MQLFDDAEHLAEARYRRLLKQQPSYVWRRFSDGEVLKAYVFLPENHQKDSMAPSVILFHGGMLVGKSVADFVPWALHLTQLGVVCILPEYRTSRQYDIGIDELLEEAREAWLWTYENAEELGLDSSRISVAGADVGGLMALHVALPDERPKWKLWGKKPEVGPQPAALVLFRPVCDLEVNSAFKLVGEIKEDIITKFNPLQRIGKNLPPLYIAHGGYDRLLPPVSSHKLALQWKKRNNTVRWELIDTADHTFYHFNVNARHFEFLVNSLQEFMIERGIWDEGGDLGAGLLV